MYSHRDAVTNDLVIRGAHVFADVSTEQACARPVACAVAQATVCSAVEGFQNFPMCYT